MEQQIERGKRPIFFLQNYRRLLRRKLLFKSTDLVDAGMKCDGHVRHEYPRHTTLEMVVGASKQKYWLAEKDGRQAQQFAPKGFFPLATVMSSRALYLIWP